ncbi:MAG: hypothetical protein M1817_004458, partial [Caeruleum heppii]
ERVVTTSWGTRPLMILCPFVFLLTRDDVPPLRLQPTEVGSAHWVSLRALVSPSLRTLEYCDISDRLARRGGYVVRAFLRAMLGQMTFAAVQLLPTESVYCSTAGDFLPPTQATSESLLERVEGWWAGSHASSPDPARPLLLWGLTLGILADFLDLFPRTDPSHEPIRFWTYPSFSPADVRLIMWLTTYSFRRKKEREMARAWAEGDGEEERGDVTARVEEGLDVVGGEQRQPAADNQPAKLARDVNNGKRRRRGGSRSSVVVTMLEGYWGLVQRAVIVALLLRGTVGVGVMASLWRIYRRRRGST